MPCRPVPCSAIVCWPAVVLSVTIRLPLLEPGCVGENAIWIVQLLPG